MKIPRVGWAIAFLLCLALAALTYALLPDAQFGR
jgi:hypothetical protein